MYTVSTCLGEEREFVSHVSALHPCSLQDSGSCFISSSVSLSSWMGPLCRSEGENPTLCLKFHKFLNLLRVSSLKSSICCLIILKQENHRKLALWCGSIRSMSVNHFRSLHIPPVHFRLLHNVVTQGCGSALGSGNRIRMD